MPKISIIVPVYKAEAYLNKCVDSLLAQTFIDFEIILVDDGSPDRSGKICDEYAHKDLRLKVIHKENGGVSSARQCGLDNAQGEYIIHADPDDWVESTMLEELYLKAIETGAELIFCDFYENRGGEQKYVTQQPKEETPNSVLTELLLQQMHGSCWNKLVKRVCYTKYGVSFPKDFNLCEDLYVNALLCNRIQSIAYLPKAFYHYVLGVNVNAYTGNFKVHNVIDRCRMAMALGKELMLNNETEYALSVLKLTICLYSVSNGANLDLKPLYDTCHNVKQIIWHLPKIHIKEKILLWADYMNFTVLKKCILVSVDMYSKCRTIIRNFK